MLSEQLLPSLLLLRAKSLLLSVLQVRGCLEGRCVVDIALGFRCAAQDGSSAVDAFAVCSSGVVYEFSLGWVANEVVRGPYLRLRPPVPEPIEFTPFCFDLVGCRHFAAKGVAAVVAYVTAPNAVEDAWLLQL